MTSPAQPPPPRRHHLTLAHYRALRERAAAARRKSGLRRAAEGALDMIVRAGAKIGVQLKSAVPAEFPPGGLPGVVATAVRDQPDGDTRCTAYAVAGAMELLCCRERGSAIDVPYVSVRNIFARAGEDLDRAVEAAQAGVVDERCWPETAASACSNAAAHRWRADLDLLNADGSKVVTVMRRHLAEVGPLVIAIPVFSNFETHSGPGIYVASGTAEAAHALCIVGYERRAGTDVWLVRNSYGRGWGQDGYSRLRVRDPDLEPEAVVYVAKSVQHPL